MVDWSKASDEEIFAELQRSQERPFNLGAPIDVITRGAVKGLGALPDLAALPYNLYQAYQGKEGLPSISEKLGELYDIPTFGRHKPTSFAGKAAETAAEFITGGAGIGKAARFLAPKTGKDLAALAGAGIGTEAGREVSPDNALLPLLGGLAGGIAPGAISGAARGFLPSKNGVGAFEQIAGQAHPEKGKYVEPAIKGLQNRALNERAPIEESYRNAREAAATGTKAEFKDFASNVQRKLEDQGIHAEDAPGISGFLKTLEKETSKDTVSINALEKRRQILNNMIEKSEEHGTKARALETLKKSFDDTWNDIVENALQNSNEPQHAKTLEEFKHARNLHRAWQQKYSTDNPKEFGKKFVSDMVDRARNYDQPFTPESITNRLFGSSEMGFQEQTPYIYDELAKHLHPEELDSIKLEALGRILKPVKESNFTVGDARSGKKRWETFLKDNHTLSNKLFDPARKKEISKFFDEAIKARNPSIFQEELSKLPFVGRSLAYAYSDLPKASIALPEIGTSSNRSNRKQENPYSTMSDEELLRILGQ